jgi:hypothetical protein
MDHEIHIPNWGHIGGGPRPAPDLVMNVSSMDITADDLMDTIYFDSLHMTTRNGNITLGVGVTRAPPCYDAHPSSSVRGQIESLLTLTAVL